MISIPELFRRVEEMRKEDWAKAPFTPPTVEQMLKLLDSFITEEQEVNVYILGDLILDGTLRSYRGYYDQLALGYCIANYNSEPIMLTRLMEMLNEAVGKEFEGYKGGMFMMYPSTPVWLANYGQWPGAVITGARLEYNRLYLQTAMVSGL